MTEKNKKGVRPSPNLHEEIITKEDVEAAKAARMKAAVQAVSMSSSGNPFA